MAHQHDYTSKILPGNQHHVCSPSSIVCLALPAADHRRMGLTTAPSAATCRCNHSRTGGWLQSNTAAVQHKKWPGNTGAVWLQPNMQVRPPATPTGDYITPFAATTLVNWHGCQQVLHWATCVATDCCRWQHLQHPASTPGLWSMAVLPPHAARHAASVWQRGKQVKPLRLGMPRSFYYWKVTTGCLTAPPLPLLRPPQPPTPVEHCCCWTCCCR
jgi:hypothetical protein